MCRELQNYQITYLLWSQQNLEINDVNVNHTFKMQKSQYYLDQHFTTLSKILNN